MTSNKENDNGKYLINTINIQFSEDDCAIAGWNKITEFLSQTVLNKAQNSTCVIGIDGYIGTNWQLIKSQLEKLLSEKHFQIIFLDIETCLLPEEEINNRLKPFLSGDPIFGKVYTGNLNSFYDANKLKNIKTKLSEIKSRANPKEFTVIVCYGTGALLSMLRSHYDLKMYFDLTREAVLVRNKNWSQLSGKTQSIGPKKLYYVDMPINDKYRNHLLNKIDYYVDGNDVETPILISKKSLQRVTSALASIPFRLKYLYEPGPWGGQWLKKIRHLPPNWVNCAWSYEAISTEMSLLVGVGDVIFELPWTTFFYMQYESVMGNVSKRRFHGEFPVRFDYLDTIDGEDLSIQVHPGTTYIRENFGEHYHQGEMYYIVEAKEGASVNLGLNENTEIEKFKEAALKAEKEGIGFNYSDYVNKVPGKKHDLLMIPPGTVHGSGMGLVVLEISATTYRYTFKIYDHLRPDLDGTMRPIHIEHAFNEIRQFRRSKWVRKNLIQEPRLIREGKGWKELLIGDRREFFHVVYRLEFDDQVMDDTCGNFHILTLVEGEAVELHAIDDESKTIKMKYSETIIVPACLGKYKMVNQGQGQCKVVKSKLR
ncbi:MAG: class I mannose-6-phosphate isomerase [Anaerolineaceae bacterium]